MARIAITGGTGFVGLHTSRALQRAGHSLRLLARGTRRGPRLQGAETVRADVVTGKGLVETLTGCDVVVHLVAIIVEKKGQTFEAVNGKGTENVARAAREAGVGHLVHISAIGAGPDPAYPYLESKWQGEQAVMGSGVPYTVIRPSLIYGPGDGFFTTLTKLIRLNPVVPVVGDGRALFQPIAATDLARIVVDVVDHGPHGRAFEVGGPDHLTYEQIIDTIKAELGVHRLKAHIPVRAMVPLAFLMATLLPRPPVTPGQLKLLEKSNITRLDAVPVAFGFQPLRFAENCGYLQDY